MTFSWIFDIAFLLIAAIFIIMGCVRGFIKSLIRSAKFILAIVIAYFLGSYMGLFFKDTFVGNMVYTPVHDWIDSTYQGATAGIDVEKLLEQIPPFAMTDELRATVTDAVANHSGEEFVNTVSRAVADPISTAISNLLGYVAVFLLALIGLSVLAWLLTKLADRLVFLGVANRILGGVWGALTAAIMLLVIASVLKAFFGSDPLYLDTVIVRFFGDSGALNALGFLNIGNILPG